MNIKVKTADQLLVEFKERHRKEFRRKVLTHQFPNEAETFVYGIQTFFSKLKYLKGRGPSLEEAKIKALNKAESLWPKKVEVKKTKTRFKRIKLFLNRFKKSA